MNFRIYSAWQKSADCAAVADTTNSICLLVYLPYFRAEHQTCMKSDMSKSESTIFKSKGRSEFTVLHSQSQSPSY